MDLSNAGLNYSTKQAIRSLGYGPAAKVAIKFKRAWWIHDLKDYNVKMGGLGHSDLTARTCMYVPILQHLRRDEDGRPVKLLHLAARLATPCVANVHQLGPRPEGQRRGRPEGAALPRARPFA